MVKEYRALNLTEFAAAVEESAANSGGVKLWFRGSADREKYKLLPSLYRRPDLNDFSDFQKIEKYMIGDFRYRSPPFIADLPTSDLELLFLMQHYGVPTRLLDWTENPFVALFFAVLQSFSNLPEDVDAAVWAINPKLMNEFSLKHISHHGGAIQISDSSARGYKPDSDEINAEPVAIFGVHNSARIVAQRGVFVIFGKNLSPLDQNQELLATGALSVIVIPHDQRPTLREGLQAIGLTDSTVFPDLDGLAREIRRRYQY
jgi:hypothetical protein